MSAPRAIFVEERITDPAADFNTGWYDSHKYGPGIAIASLNSDGYANLRLVQSEDQTTLDVLRVRRICRGTQTLRSPFYMRFVRATVISDLETPVTYLLRFYILRNVPTYTMPIERTSYEFKATVK